MRRLGSSIAILLAGSLLLTVAGVASRHAADSSAVRRGGTLRIGVRLFDQIDPALAFFGLAWPVESATCELLMRYPDKPPPAGYRPVPGASAGYPRISRDGKTYAFTIRKALRFSNGEPLTARNFAGAIKRLLNPAYRDAPDVYGLETITGVDAFRDGTTNAIAGLRANGLRLTFKLTKPTSDFLARMAGTALCPVPLRLPPDPEGVGAFAGSGPYYIAKFVRNDQVVLKPNRLYHGNRPRHLDQIVITTRYSSRDEIIQNIEANKLDGTDFVGTAVPRLAARYGVNKSRFRVVPGVNLYYLYLNTSRPLFRNNVKLRRATNFAINRRTLLQQFGPYWGNTTDQYLPPKSPGFRNAPIYPLNRPDLATARALARGHLRSGKAVLYVRSDAPWPSLAQVVQQDLSKIGIQVEITEFPPGVYGEKISTPGEPVDVVLGGWGGNWMDPYFYIDLQLASRFVPSPGVGNVASNTSRFASPHFDRLMQRARALKGEARYRAYGNLDVQLARDAAPMAAFAVQNFRYFFSTRVGCIATNFYGWDLGAACLKR